MFQSTPPVWGATHATHDLHISHFVSIHAPRVGGDTDPGVYASVQVVSIHAPPCGGRPVIPNHREGVLVVSIHAPVWGRRTSKADCRGWKRFQSTPPCGGRPSCS